MSDSVDELYRQKRYGKWLKGNAVLTPPDEIRVALEDYFFKLNKPVEKTEGQ